MNNRNKYREELDLLKVVMHEARYGVHYLIDRIENEEYLWIISTHNLLFHTELNKNEIKKILRSLARLSSNKIKLIDIKNLNSQNTSNDFIKLKFSLSDLNKLRIILIKGPKIKIHKIELKPNTKTLSINNDEIIYPLVTKGINKDGRYEIIEFLWEDRKIIRHNKIIKKGFILSLFNLHTISKSYSLSATTRAIERINEDFYDKNLPIKIDHKIGKCILVITMG